MESGPFLKYGKTCLLPQSIKNLKRAMCFAGVDAETSEPIFDKTSKLPVVSFIGTVKLHGANAAVNMHHGIVSVQSRNRVLTEDSDMLDFYKFIMERSDVLEAYERRIRGHCYPELPECVGDDMIVRLTGEWCGPGVQVRVGLDDLPHRVWVLFDVSVFRLVQDPENACQTAEGRNVEMSDGEDIPGQLAKQRVCPPLDLSLEVLRSLHDDAHRMYVITEFPSFRIDVDLNAQGPTEAMAEVKRLTDEVAASCPVSKALGASGHGEGIVWVAHCTSKITKPNGDVLVRRHRCKGKTKAKAFKSTQTTKTIYNSSDFQEKVNSFCEAAVSPNRCEQGLEYLREMCVDTGDRMQGVPAFIQWMLKDVLDEEQELLAAMDISTTGKKGKVLRKALASQAVLFYNSVFPPEGLAGQRTSSKGELKPPSLNGLSALQMLDSLLAHCKDMKIIS